MARFVTKRLYDVHSAVGLSFGLLLYAILLSGTIAVVAPQMTTWAVPEARVAPVQASVDAPMRDLAEVHDIRDHIVVVELPEPAKPSLRLWWSDETARHAIDVGLDGTPEPWSPGFGEFHRRLHTNLHIPGPFGRWLIGLAGVAMVVMLVTGLVADPRWRKDRLVLRPRRAVRTALADIHKRLGLWGLPFSMVMALTGALLGLLQLILVVGALAAFEGDQEAAVEAVVGERLDPAEVDADMAPIDPLIEDARRRLGHSPRQLLVYYYGDANARVEVSAFVDDLGERAAATYSLADGSFVRRTPVSPDVGVAITNGLIDLHYATFGGTVLRLIYFLLGVGGTAMAALGSSLWVLRRRKSRGTPAPGRMARLNAGIIAGMPLATAATVLVAPWIARDASTMATFTSLYFGIVVASLVGSMAWPGFFSSRRLWAATGWLLVAAVALDMVRMGAELPRSVSITPGLATSYGGIALVGIVVLGVLRASGRNDAATRHGSAAPGAAVDDSDPTDVDDS
ncbi:MAG: PepSY-associated TM helix domain-containing protein [Myxococcota bacterium]